MTVILANHLIEGPILASDSRATQRKTKKPSDTATKILPLTDDMIVGISGNPYQAAAILHALNDEFLLNHSVLNPDTFESGILRITKKVDPVDVVDSRCSLVFAYHDKSKKQPVPIEKLKFHLEKEGKPFVGGQHGIQLMMYLMRNVHSKEILFNFPKSYVLEVSYPLVKTRQINMLEIEAWGSGGDFLKKQLEVDSHKLWSLESLKDVPWFKTMILAVTLEDMIRKNGGKLFIGGFPQIVALTPKGLFFQSYNSGGPDKERHYSMTFNGRHWEQTDIKTGKVVKTQLRIFGKRSFDEKEIVDFTL